MKQRFGEFAATPQANPAYLTIDPTWVERNIVSTEVPLLGTVTCHRKLIPMVRGALYEIGASSLASEIKVYSDAGHLARSRGAPRRRLRITRMAPRSTSTHRRTRTERSRR